MIGDTIQCLEALRHACRRVSAIRKAHAAGQSDRAQSVVIGPDKKVKIILLSDEQGGAVLKTKNIRRSSAAP